MLAEDFGAAEALLRPALERFHEIGEQGVYSTQAGTLAHALYAQDRFEEAKSFAKVCETAAAAMTSHRSSCGEARWRR